MILDEALHVVAVRVAIEKRPGLRFDDLVQAVRVVHPDADVCVIDREARPYESGDPGAYTYEADRQRVLPGMEE